MQEILQPEFQTELLLLDKTKRKLIYGGSQDVSQRSSSNQRAPSDQMIEKQKMIILSNMNQEFAQNTLLKNFMNQYITQLTDYYPKLNNNLVFRRAMFSTLKKNDFQYIQSESVYMRNYFSQLNDYMKQLSKYDQDLLKDIQSQSSQIILLLAQLIDETSDTFLQNSFLIMDGSNLPEINMASLGASYFNASLLDKGVNHSDVPRLTFINLGMLKQELNKNFFFYTGYPERQKSPSPDLRNNLQYISLFHSWENEEAIENQGTPWSVQWNHNNCIELAMNHTIKTKMTEYLNENKKCPKIIGSSEFQWLFDLVIKLVRSHRPGVIIFSYDFSLTKSHNHYYDLKQDVLGYFTYMLSLISNQHVIFLANTNIQNHIYQSEEYLRAQKNVVSFDMLKSLANYATKSQMEMILKPENLQAIKWELKKLKDLLPQISITNSDTNTISKHSLAMPEIMVVKSLDSNKKKFEEDAITLKYMEPSTQNMDDTNEINFLISKYNFFSKENKNNINFLAMQEQMHSKNLYTDIQEQFYSVILALSEQTNYLKIKKSIISSSFNSISTEFQKSIIEQVVRTKKNNLQRVDKNEGKKSLQPFSRLDYQQYMLSIKIKYQISLNKQEKYIRDFIHFNNKEELNTMKQILKLKNDGIVDRYMEYDAEHLVKQLNDETNKKILTEELKIKLQIKKYTSSLLKNWIFDLRRNKKIYLNIEEGNIKVRFFFSERSQYLVDYQGENLIIYFFNVQRGALFKNFILNEIGENLFNEQEIKYENQQIPDFLWKKVRPSEFLTDQVKEQDAMIFSQMHNLEELEIYNTALCMSEKCVYRFFGEIVNPHTWKQKELSLLVFSVEKFKPDERFFNMRILNINYRHGNKFCQTIPRTGCTAILVKDQIMVFGGVGYNGFIYNTIEVYEIQSTKKDPVGNEAPTNEIEENLETPVQITKTHLMQNVFKPLFCPISFKFENIIYFIGGEFSSSTVSEIFKEMFIQQIKIINNKKVEIQSELLNLPNLRKKFNLNLIDNPADNNPQKQFLKHLSKFQFTTVNQNQGLFIPGQQNSLAKNDFSDKSVFLCSLTGQINTGIDTILEKSIVISISKISTDQLKNIQCEITLQKPILLKTFARKENNSIEFFLKSENEKPEIQSTSHTNIESKHFTTISTTADTSEIHSSIKQKDDKKSMNSFLDESQVSSLKTDFSERSTNISTMSDIKSIQQKRDKEDNKIHAEKDKDRFNLPKQKSEEEEQNKKIDESQTILLKGTGEQEKQKKVIDNKQIIEEQKREVDEKQIIPSSKNEKIIEPEKNIIPQNKNILPTLPSYFMVIFKEYKSNWVLAPNQDTQKMEKKFEFKLRLIDEDFQGTSLINDHHFLTYLINQKTQSLDFYKTISFQEAMDFKEQEIDLQKINLIFKGRIKLAQKTLNELPLAEISSEFDLIYPNLFNRYIVVDDTHLYLINGAPLEEKEVAFNKERPCERISITTRESEPIPQCKYLQPKTSILLSNSSFIIYIGIFWYEDLDEDDNEDQNDDGSILIAQIFDKKKKEWVEINIMLKDIQSQFEKFQFQLGCDDSTIIAINTKKNKKNKDKITIHLIRFELTQKQAQISTLLVDYFWTENNIYTCSSPLTTNTIFVANSNASTIYTPLSIFSPSPN